MDRALRRLDMSARTNVEVREVDLTGILSHVASATEEAVSAGSLPEALSILHGRLQECGIEPVVMHDVSADLVISSCVLSQLVVWPTRFMKRTLMKQFTAQSESAGQSILARLYSAYSGIPSLSPSFHFDCINRWLKHDGTALLFFTDTILEVRNGQVCSSVPIVHPSAVASLRNRFLVRRQESWTWHSTPEVDYRVQMFQLRRPP
jgi:hypothetical protein